MPNPKRKHSHARTASRRTHWTTELPELSIQRHEGQNVVHLMHNATLDGYYKGRRLPGFKDKTR